MMQKTKDIDNKRAILEKKAAKLRAIVPLGPDNKGQGFSFDELKEAVNANEELDKLIAEEHNLYPD